MRFEFALLCVGSSMVISPAWMMVFKLTDATAVASIASMGLVFMSIALLAILISGIVEMTRRLLRREYAHQREAPWSVAKFLEWEQLSIPGTLTWIGAIISGATVLAFLLVDPKPLHMLALVGLFLTMGLTFVFIGLAFVLAVKMFKRSAVS